MYKQAELVPSIPIHHDEGNLLTCSNCEEHVEMCAMKADLYMNEAKVNIFYRITGDFISVSLDEFSSGLFSEKGDSVPISHAKKVVLYFSMRHAYT